MTVALDEALAYDASPSGDLACAPWCAGVGHALCCGDCCDCGMERARAVVATLQAAVTAGEGPPMR